LSASECAAPLGALEAEGFAMRGCFTPDASAEEWCERRLLSRIHHYTLRRLRAEIEPVGARDFLRFLFDWQHVPTDARMEGPKALDRVVAQLEGFEAPAAAWESEILPSRLSGYEPRWLDERCLAGQIGWQWPDRWQRKAGTGTHHADCVTAPTPCGRVDIVEPERRCHDSEPSSAVAGRLP
jgi:ATP-dependent Lhr-like helicase